MASGAVFLARPKLAPEPLGCAGQLVCAFLALHPEAIAELEPTDGDCIVIRWNDARDLRFIVSRPTLRWPAVNARAYFRPDPYEAALECRYARLASELLELPYEKE